LFIFSQCARGTQLNIHQINHDPTSQYLAFAAKCNTSGLNQDIHVLYLASASPKPPTSHLQHKQRVCMHRHKAFLHLHALCLPSKCQIPQQCFLYLFVESINDGLDPFHGLVRRHAQADARAAMSPINHFCDPDSCSRFALCAPNTP